MKRSGFALVLGLALLCVLPSGGGAQISRTGMSAEATGEAYGSISAEAAGEAYRSSRYQAALTLEVLPLDAQVLLDGHPIGTGRELVAQAVAVTPGWHTVEVGAPGFYPYTGRFVADQHSSANLFVVNLVPVR